MIYNKTVYMTVDPFKTNSCFTTQENNEVKYNTKYK